MHAPLTKLIENRLDALAMANTISLVFEERKIAFGHSCGKLFWVELFAVSRTFGNPFGELEENAEIGVNGRFAKHAC